MKTHKMANKRILIFSPELRDQQGIEDRVRDNCKDIFDAYYGEIVIQKFMNVNESINRGQKVGVGGEIFVVFDKYFELKERRMYRLAHSFYPEAWREFKQLRALVGITQQICEKEEHIPFVEYEGEMNLMKEGTFREKLQLIKPNILAKILELDYVSNFPTTDSTVKRDLASNRF